MNNKDISLEDLPGVGEKTAEKLREAGFYDVMSIAAASPGELAAIAEVGEAAAIKMITAARQELEIGFEPATVLLEKRKLMKRISTNSNSLNDLLGGGVQTQAITEAHGPFGSGKSQLAFQLSVLAQMSVEDGGLGGEVAFIVTENTFRPERIMQIAEAAGLDSEEALSKIVIARAFNANHQMLLVDKIENLIQEGRNIKLIVVDSLMSHFRAEYIGRGTLARRQQQLNKHLHKLQRMADIHNLAVYVTNQVMSKPDQLFGFAMKAVGGHILAHAATYRLFLRRSKGNKRIARLIDSPDLPEGEALFCLTQEGINDV
jgi:DNA repair protein RadA